MNLRCPRRWWLFATALLAVIATGALGACASPPASPPAAQVVHIAAPAGTLPLLQDLTAAYLQLGSYPYTTFDLQAASSQLAQEALEDGQVDLAVSSWLTRTDLPGLAVAPVAWDAAAVILHPRNPITGVTLLQLRDLYRGRILDWAALGGRSGDVTVISREDGSGLRAAFEHTVMGGQPVTLSALVMPGDAAVIDFVAARPAAVGYVSLLGLRAATSQDNAQTAQVKTLPVEGVVPIFTELAQGGYHLVHPLYLVARQPVALPTQSFIDFVLSPAGQAVVARHTTPVMGE